MDAIFPLSRGCPSSFNRLGPAVVVKLMPIPRTKRPPMKTFRSVAAAWSMEPATLSRDPTWTIGRRPKRSAGADAKKAPTKPPINTMAVMRPKISAEGCPMANLISYVRLGKELVLIAPSFRKCWLGGIGNATNLRAMASLTEKTRR